MAFTNNANSEGVPSTASSPATIIHSESELTEQACSPGMMEEESMENENAGKRPAWKKPSNGQEVPVMGAHSWPALSKGSSSKSSSSDSLKALALDNSTSPVSSSQGTGSIPLSPQIQVSTNSNSNSSQNRTNTISSRQRAMKRNANPSFSGGISRPPAQQGSAAQVNIINHSATQSHGAQQRPHYKNRNGQNNNYVGRHEEGRNFNIRDPRFQPQRLFSTFPRHAHPPLAISAPFIPSQIPQQGPPFRGPMSFHDFPSPPYYVAAPPPEAPRGVPFIAPMTHPVFYPPADPQLHSRIVNQIDYYFSNENLVKDVYLRQNMDDQGWVPIKLIAGFKKVSLLTDNIHLILDSLRNSAVVEVQGDKVRSRHNWMTWVPRNYMQLPNVSATQPQHGNAVLDMLAARVHNVSLDPNTSGWTQSHGGRA